MGSKHAAAPLSGPPADGLTTILPATGRSDNRLRRRQGGFAAGTAAALGYVLPHSVLRV